MDSSLPREILNHRKAKHPVHPLILSRWSPHAMTGEPISKEELMSLLEAAHWAPSSYNAQPWRFIYAFRETPKWNELIKILTPKNAKWAIQSAVLILVISHKVFEHNGKPSITHSFDTGAAWGYLALQGSFMKLAVRAMQGFDYERGKVICSVPDPYRVECMIAVGKRGKVEDLPEEFQEKEFPSGRKEIEEIATENQYER
jgi:nitroreductase